MKKYFSYSEMSKWEWSKEEYIDQYVNGNFTPPNDAMKLGSLIHKTIEDPKFPWIMGLEQDKLDVDLTVMRKIFNKVSKKRPGDHEQVFFATTQYGTKLMAIFDGFQKKERILHEYKTSDKDKWFQGRVDDNDQLSFYAYVYRLRYHAYFSQIQLHAINVTKGTVKTFKTARGPKDIEYISNKIERICDEIHNAGLWEKRRSSRDIDKTNQLKLSNI